MVMGPGVWGDAYTLVGYIVVQNALLFIQCRIPTAVLGKTDDYPWLVVGSER